MKTAKTTINVVWFKRDLRLVDHAPLRKSVQSPDTPTLLLTLIEPSLRSQGHLSQRHIDFYLAGATEIQQQLGQMGHHFYILQAEALQVFQKLSEAFHIKTVFSYQESGDSITYQRDKTIKTLFKHRGIQWDESPMGGVLRTKQPRRDWKANWNRVMSRPLDLIDLENLNSQKLPNTFDSILVTNPTLNLTPSFQKGGPSAAHLCLDSFLLDRSRRYRHSISKPAASREGCSRLSPYLAWGNLSVRQVLQAVETHSQRCGPSRDLEAFKKRLQWRCHFIQKLENDESIEFQNINPAFNQLNQEVNESLLKRWQQGETGYPLVDAGMRCLIETGYVNFRMRAMLISFVTHHLWQPWQGPSNYLARLFLDYEPGIHFPQVQMQAGTIGTNILRIYNPVKQSKENDPTGRFIRRWVPELRELPLAYLHEPWKMTPMEQIGYDLKIGSKYPSPIIQFENTGRFAREQLWKIKNSDLAKSYTPDILSRLTNASSESGRSKD